MNDETMCTLIQVTTMAEDGTIAGCVVLNQAETSSAHQYGITDGQGLRVDCCIHMPGDVTAAVAMKELNEAMVEAAE